MSFLDYFRKKPQKRNLDRYFGGEILSFLREYSSGNVGPQMAANIAAVYACQTAICESFAMIPCQVFKKKKGRSVIDTDHPLSNLLAYEPNPFMDSFGFFETGQLSILDHGATFNYIDRNGVGEIASISPLLADHMEIEIDGNELSFLYSDPDEDQPGKKKKYRASQILHVRNRSKDGITGLSPLTAAAKTVSFAGHLLDHGNSLFSNGAFMSGFLKVPFEFESDEQRKSFVDSFKEILGSQNAGKVGLIESGAEWQDIEMTSKDAQFIESKRFSVTEIARIFRVPPHMIQDLSEGASYSSIEQQSINFVQYTIQPWVTRWEMALRAQLFTEKEKKAGYCVRFDVNELIRGDLKSRTEAIVQQLKYGLSTINEGRELLEKNPTDEEVGNQIFVDQNMVKADQVGKEPEPAPEPSAPAPEETPEPSEQDQAIEDLTRQAFQRIRNREIAFFSSQKALEENRKRDFFEKHPDFMNEILRPIAALRGNGGEERLKSFTAGYTKQLKELVEKTEREGIKRALSGDFSEEKRLFLGEK